MTYSSNGHVSLRPSVPSGGGGPSAAPVIALVGFTHAVQAPPIPIGDGLAAFAIVAASCICSIAFTLIVVLPASFAHPGSV